MKFFEGKGQYFSPDGGGGGTSTTFETHLGLPRELKTPAKEFLQTVRDKGPRKRLSNESLEVPMYQLGSRISRSITEGYPSRRWEANARLESKGGLSGSIEYDYHGQTLGTLNISIGPAKAKIEIVNNPNHQQRERVGTALYDNFSQMENDFTNLVTQVKPTVQRWLDALGDKAIKESSKAGEVSAYRLTEDPREFLQWAKKVFPEIYDDINKFMTRDEDPTRKSLAAAILLQIGRGHRPIGQVKQFLDAPTSAPSRDMAFLHGTVLELIGEKDALLALKHLEQGELAALLGEILQGKAIEVNRLKSEEPGADAEKTTFGLPEDFAKLVSVHRNTITIDFAETGKDKAVFVLAAVARGVGLVADLAGVNLVARYNITYGGVPTEFFPPSDSPLSPNPIFLVGKTGNLRLYQSTVQQRIETWKQKGHMIATLTGPTGAGKTTLAQTVLRDYINLMDRRTGDDVLIYEARADLDEQGRPKLLNPDRLLSALRQYRELLQKRQGENRMTTLVVDNFHLLPFHEMNNELRREFLNEFDVIGDLFEEGGRIGGVIFLGENLPQGLDMSILQQHRAEWVDLRVVGKEALFKSATDIFAYKAMEMLHDVRGEVVNASRGAGQPRDISYDDIEGIRTRFKNYFSQQLNIHEALRKLASDEAMGQFLTLSHWASVADTILPQLHQQVYDYLDKGTSEWLVKGKAGAVQLTTAGSQALTKQLSIAFDRTYDLASTTAESKLGGKSGVPPPARTEVSPTRKTPPKEVPRKEVREQTDLAGRIKAARAKAQSTIKSLKDLENELNRLVKEREARNSQVQEKYGDSLRFFSERGLLTLLLGKAGAQESFRDPQETLSLLDQLSAELNDGGNSWLQAVNQITGNAFADQLGQAGAIALKVIATQVDNREIWQDPNTAKALSTIVLGQLEQIREALGERGLSMLSQTREEIRLASADIDTREIEKKLLDLSI